MPIATQAKLLRVLEDHNCAGSAARSRPRSTLRPGRHNKVPEEAVARGELRNDLYYRLNVFNIHMPTLREHKEDVPELVQSLLRI